MEIENAQRDRGHFLGGLVIAVVVLAGLFAATSLFSSYLDRTMLNRDGSASSSTSTEASTSKFSIDFSNATSTSDASSMSSRGPVQTQGPYGGMTRGGLYNVMTPRPARIGPAPQ